jgi:hypothetical protein
LGCYFWVGSTAVAAAAKPARFCWAYCLSCSSLHPGQGNSTTGKCCHVSATHRSLSPSLLGHLNHQVNTGTGSQSSKAPYFGISISRAGLVCSLPGWEHCKLLHVWCWVKPVED